MQRPRDPLATWPLGQERRIRQRPVDLLRYPREPGHFLRIQRPRDPLATFPEGHTFLQRPVERFRLYPGLHDLRFVILLYPRFFFGFMQACLTIKLKNKTTTSEKKKRS